VDEVEFGRYQLVSLLGEGGMGEVWRAHDTVTDRVVAIKLLPPRLSKDDDFQQRFRREAHAAARLETPHVVPIYDYGEIDGRLFVCMRLIKGRDLATVLAEGPLEPVRAARIIGQVAEALHAAHGIGLIHRDIKPSNILLDDRDFAYLIDFGIARIADDTRMTKTGNTIGTFAYIAPERLDGRGDEDARVDIYSLACVLYECLAGAPPFGGDTMARLVAAHLNTPPPRPSIARPDVPAQVDEVIATGMAKDPDQRYATTVELADAAHNAITTPISRRPPTPAPAAVLAYDTRRHPEPADATLAATPRTAFGLAAAPQTEAAEQLSEQGIIPTTPRSPWSRPTMLVAVIAAIVVITAIVGITGYLLRPHSPASQTPTAQPPPPPPASTTPPPPPPPLGAEALQGLLLSSEQIAADATSPTPMRIVEPTFNDMLTATFSDPDCSGVVAFRDSHTYANTGWTAVLGNQYNNHEGDAVIAFQFLVLFPSAHDAQAFFATSAPKWQACSNRQLTVTQPTTNKPMQFAVKSVTNRNGMLSTTVVGGTGGPCERALTVANNVAIDASVCKVPGASVDNLAVNIAHQIADKVPTT
jgi:serine/threonine kinase PknH